MARHVVQVLIRPGRKRKREDNERLVEQMRQVAGTCFTEVPHYQVLSGDKSALDRAVIAVARSPEGQMVAFCSAQLLEVPGRDVVVHFGLTCVRPEVRGTGLTHALLSKLLTHWIFLHRPLRGSWFSNVACVLSSLGNVALHFDDVYPSPFSEEGPSAIHLGIAQAISSQHRVTVHLRQDSTFDPRRFVFEGGNKETIFEKKADDDAYHHRRRELTQWYQGLADLNQGDAVLQVGRVSSWLFVRYALHQMIKALPMARQLLGRRSIRPIAELKRA